MGSRSRKVTLERERRVKRERKRARRLAKRSGTTPAPVTRGMATSVQAPLQTRTLLSRSPRTSK